MCLSEAREQGAEIEGEVNLHQNSQVVARLVAGEGIGLCIEILQVVPIHPMHFWWLIPGVRCSEFCKLQLHAAIQQN